MQREGRCFIFGYSHFSDGVSYCWPDERLDYDALFLDKRDELQPILLNRLRDYIQDFKVHTHPHYPYSSKGMKGLEFHLGDGGRWIEAWKMLGGYFVNQHNLDAWNEKAACFNIGSDILEYLDKTILAPRVVFQGEEYLLKYPIPKGRDLITSSAFNEEILARIYKIIGLEGEVRIVREEGIQKIENSHGQIIIQGNMCKGRHFKSWDIPKASFVIAKLMPLYED